MALHVQCPTCGTNSHVADSAAGSNVVCPSCAAEMTIPRPEPVPLQEPANADFPPPVFIEAPPQPPPPLPGTTSGTGGPKVLTTAIQRYGAREDDDEEDSRPSRRRSSRRSRRDDDDDDDDDEDEYERPRRSRRGFRCPYCDTDRYPMIQEQISPVGWALFIVFLLTCWPLFFIGLLIKEEIRVCSDCGSKLSW